MNKSVRNVLYILIIVICIIAIFIGVYTQFFKKATEDEGEYNISGESTTTNTVSQAEIKDEFKEPENIIEEIKEIIKNIKTCLQMNSLVSIMMKQI